MSGKMTLRTRDRHGTRVPWDLKTRVLNPRKNRLELVLRSSDIQFLNPPPTRSLELPE